MIQSFFYFIANKTYFCVGIKSPDMEHLGKYEFDKQEDETDNYQ